MEPHSIIMRFRKLFGAVPLDQGIRRECVVV